MNFTVIIILLVMILTAVYEPIVPKNSYFGIKIKNLGISGVVFTTLLCIRSLRKNVGRSDYSCIVTTNCTTGCQVPYSQHSIFFPTYESAL